MYWEGPDAVEEINEPESTIIPAPKKQKLIKRDNPVEDLPTDSEEDLSSTDEYLGDESKTKGKGKVC